MGNRNQFKLEEDWKRYCENERERNRVNRKVEYDLAKSAGVCYRCGGKCLINIKTGLPYHACVTCRNDENNRVKEFRKTNSI